MRHSGSDRRPTASAGVDAEAHEARRSRWATVALVAVLLGVSVFAVWSSQATGAAANRAVVAGALSDDYADAASAVGTEESLERKYRLEPGPEVQAMYSKAAAQFVTALGNVRRDGSADDRSFVEQVLVRHQSYLRAIDRLFRATDRKDTVAALQIDNDEVDPAFGAMQKAVLAAARSRHQESLAQLASLQQLEAITQTLTPVVFVLGLMLAAALAGVTRGHRRLLAVERELAVYEALHDSLTGLPNRTLLADRFSQALASDARYGTETGLLLIDLDRFKEINDTFGHHYGDELLAQVGPRLRAQLREVDTVARLGGDEFAVLLSEVRSIDHAVRVADKLRISLEAPFRVLGVDLDVEASIGVVVSGEHGQDVTTLLQRADIAMYVAKSRTRGVSIYDPNIDQHTPEKLALLGDLRRALENHELLLHYQPKIALSTGDVVGVEALVRWQHPQRGLIRPDDFIPMAEHTGLIGALTRYVLDAALAQGRRWADAGRPLTVAVNLSARNLLDERLPEMVADMLAAHGVAAGLLELEVTESAFLAEPVRAGRVLAELSALGVRLSIDDFGAGYTSLSQLKTLPVNELKIDKSFVMTMSRDISSDLIVHSVIDLGHNLGLSIVAEGVEDVETLTALRGYGCDIAQGYYYSRPVTPDVLGRWLTERPPNLGSPSCAVAAGRSEFR